MKRRRKRNNGFSVFIFLMALAAAIAYAYVYVLPTIRYPVRFEGEIRQAAGMYGMPPELIAAIVNTESGYDPMARSSVGAMGLMQIMPDTGRWIAGKFDEDGGYRDDWLYTPEYSLKYGCWYVHFLLSRYDGSFTNTVAAYHAGQGAVDEWLKNPDLSRDGRVLTDFPETAHHTKNYVNKVRKAYDYYQKAYR